MNTNPLTSILARLAASSASPSSTATAAKGPASVFDRPKYSHLKTVKDGKTLSKEDVKTLGSLKFYLENVNQNGKRGGSTDEDLALIKRLLKEFKSAPKEPTFFGSITDILKKQGWSLKSKEGPKSWWTNRNFSGLASKPSSMKELETQLKKVDPSAKLVKPDHPNFDDPEIRSENFGVTLQRQDEYLFLVIPSTAAQKRKFLVGIDF